jgi:hypothetical protein
VSLTAFQRTPMLSIIDRLPALPADFVCLLVDEALLESPDTATVTAPDDHPVARKGVAGKLANLVVYPLDRAKPAVVVGRKPQCDVCIRDSRISSRHAQLNAAPELTYWIADLSSSNGTFVKGRDVSKAKSLIGPGSTFHLALLPVLLLDLPRLRQIADSAHAAT